MTSVGDPSWGLEHLRSILADDGLFHAVDPDGRNWVAPALILLETGHRDEAEAMVREWEELSPDPDDDRRRLRILVDGATGAEPDPLGALDAMRVEEGCADIFWPAWKIAVAKYGGSVEDRIRAEEAMVERGHFNLPLNTLFGLPARLHLGPLYEEVGDSAAALTAYRRVVDLWSEADARGQERVREARTRIAALGG